MLHNFFLVVRMSSMLGIIGGVLEGGSCRTGGSSTKMRGAAPGAGLPVHLLRCSVCSAQVLGEVPRLSSQHMSFQCSPVM